MATEEQKKKNMLRLTRLALLGVSAGVWDLIGEGAYGLSHEIGSLLLPVLEKEMGLEIAGEDPEQVLQEIGRLFIDEFGFAGDVEVSQDGDTLTMKVHSCANRNFSDKLMAAGVGKPYICPFLCVGNAALDRMGVKAMSTIEKWKEGKGSILTFELI
jgi:hypothetical protein